MVEMEVVRELLADASAHCWEQLCTIVEAADTSTGGAEGWLIDYITEHIDGWADELRISPPHWTLATIDGDVPPYWPLVRVARLEDADVRTVRKLCKTPAMDGLQGLVLRRCKLGPKAGIQALCLSPYLKGISALSLERCLISDEGMASLMASPFVGGLTSFHWTSERFDSPRKHWQTGKSIKALAQTTQMTQLEQLTVGGDFPGFVGVELEELAMATHIQGLSSLALHGMSGTECQRFFSELEAPALTRLDLRDSDFFLRPFRKFLSSDLASQLTHLALSGPDASCLSLSKEVFQRFCETDKLPSLRHLTIAVNGLTPKCILDAPWCSQLEELILQGRVSKRTRSILAKEGLLDSGDTSPVRPTRIAASECQDVHFALVHSWDGPELVNEALPSLRTFLKGNKPTTCGSLIVELNPRVTPIEDVEMLFSCPLLVNVRELRIERNAFYLDNNDFFERCFRAIAHNPAFVHLESLDVRGMDCDGDGFRSWLEVQLSPHLSPSIKKTLSLIAMCGDQIKYSKNEGDLFGSPRIAELEELDFSGIQFGPSGARALAECEYLSQLKVLRLVSCQLEDFEATLLARSAYVKNLEVLDLKHNRKITQKAIRVLSTSSRLSTEVKKYWKKKRK